MGKKFCKELLESFAGDIRRYGGIRSTFSALEKVDDKYSEEIDKLYSDAIKEIYLKEMKKPFRKRFWWIPCVISAVGIIISVAAIVLNLL